ncbi:DUF732 domain-containing protein [Gordonia sp. MP11Mi]|uniref:DUF732 domain-containing protein n=1 Tax=Gordonia sp. MP11Mi TaxID=3022769 RepID=A0AA97GVN1_9ACTN
MRIRAVGGSGLAAVAMTLSVIALCAMTLSGCSTVDGTPTVAESERAGMSTSTSSTESQDVPSGDSPGSSSTTSIDETSSPDSSSSEGIYLKVVRQGDSFAGTSDRELIAAGEQACSDLRSGKKFLDVVDDVELAKGDVTKGARLVGGAVGALCPDQTSKISS